MRSNNDLNTQDAYFVIPIYRAQSWSRTSVDGKVIYLYDKDNIGFGTNYSLIECISHDIKFSNNADPYGQVSSGYLTIKAQTIEVKILGSRERGTRIVSDKQVFLNGHMIKTQAYVCRDDRDGIFSPDEHRLFAIPLLLCLSFKQHFFDLPFVGERAQ
jgi:hypothetical protein